MMKKKTNGDVIISDDSCAMDSSLWSPRTLSPTRKVSLSIKAVSPSWNSLNSSPQFAQTHLHLTNHTTNKPQKIILVSSSSRALYSVDLSAVNPTAEKLDFPSAESPEVLGSCHGLVLVSGRGNDSKFLWNPSLENARNCPNTQSLGICLLYNVFYLELVTTRRQMITMLWCSFTVYVLSMVIKWLCIDAWRLEYPEVPDGFYFNERLHRLLLLLICRVRFEGKSSCLLLLISIGILMSSLIIKWRFLGVLSLCCCGRVMTTELKFG